MDIRNECVTWLTSLCNPCVLEGDLNAYYKAVQDMEVMLSQDQSREQQQPSEPQTHATSKVPQKTYKAKPFTEIVRMQRPEVTRKKANKFAMDYIGSLESISQPETARTSARTELTQREKEMIYGMCRDSFIQL